MISEIIRTENISKHYEDVRAVSDMSLSVRKGEIYGFLGLNGAGKTTTITYAAWYDPAYSRGCLHQ